jgi:hypothetical protein
MKMHSREAKHIRENEQRRKRQIKAERRRQRRLAKTKEETNDAAKCKHAPGTIYSYYKLKQQNQTRPKIHCSESPWALREPQRTTHRVCRWSQLDGSDVGRLHYSSSRHAQAARRWSAV